MISLTPEAAKQVKQAAKQNQMEGAALRIAAKREADGSINYAMGFADEQYEGDATHTSEGVTLSVPPSSIELLNDCVVDFVEIEAGQHNFIFMNPNDPHYQAPKDSDSTEHHF